MGYGWISDEEIRSRSTSSAYKKGATYYKSGAVLSAARGMVVPYAGAGKEHDCISVIIREQESMPKRKGGRKDNRYLVQVYATGVTLCDCQAEPRSACRHTVAAMLHIVDSLGGIEAESPKGMNPIRGTKGDECNRYRDVNPALLFERNLIRHRGDMKKATANLKAVTSLLGQECEVDRYEMSRALSASRYRGHSISKHRDQFTAYMSYLQKLMIKRADTSQKKIKYVRYLAYNNKQTDDAFTKKVYKDAMVELAVCDAEWCTYVANAAETIGMRFPFDTKAHPNRRRSSA